MKCLARGIESYGDGVALLKVNSRRCASTSNVLEHYTNVKVADLLLDGSNDNNSITTTQLTPIKEEANHVETNAPMLADSTSAHRSVGLNNQPTVIPQFHNDPPGESVDHMSRKRSRGAVATDSGGRRKRLFPNESGRSSAPTVDQNGGAYTVNASSSSPGVTARDSSRTTSAKPVNSRLNNHQSHSRSAVAEGNKSGKTLYTSSSSQPPRVLLPSRRSPSSAALSRANSSTSNIEPQSGVSSGNIMPERWWVYQFVSHVDSVARPTQRNGLHASQEVHNRQSQ